MQLLWPPFLVRDFARLLLHLPRGNRKVELKYVEDMTGIADIVVGQRRLLSLDVLRQGEK